MSQARWTEIEKLYHESLALSPDRRPSFLSQACGGDMELRKEVESLLASEGRADDLLEQPAWFHLAATPDETLMAGGEGPGSRSLALTPGTELGFYRIDVLLGFGGMGEVYQAEDTRLKRPVAIKILQQAASAALQDRSRFLEEARAASALNHPNIVQIYELESHNGLDFLVMEFVPGGTLAKAIKGNRLSIEQAIGYAEQISSALAAAHTAGIVHRDVKPGNIMIAADGKLRLLDFGLAKRVGASGSDSADGAFFGTASYMSPEQAQGKVVDARSDVFSTGATLYEMLAGHCPFEGETTRDIIRNVIHGVPSPVRNIPRQLAEIVDRCLEKDPARRYPSAKELAGALEAFRKSRLQARAWRKRAGLAAVLLLAAAVAGWQSLRYARARWVRNSALPQIRASIGKSDFATAFNLIRDAQRILPDDPQLQQYWSEIAIPVNLQTTPPGGRVSYRPYADGNSSWQSIGVTPVSATMPALAYVVVRIEKDGFETAEIATFPLMLKTANIPLEPRGSMQQGMVRVPAVAPWAGPSAAAVRLPDFLLDKFEVTNADYQKFVDSGGYHDTKYWPRMGEQISLYRDASGTPGPATWEGGRYPAGQENYPVAGISWFEAMAYCRFSGKVLPTVSHWNKAFAFGISSDILHFSNFNGKGSSPVGELGAVSAFGVHDLAGNVKEWLFNEGPGGRAIFGSSWAEPGVFQLREIRDPNSRGVAFGCRCALQPGGIDAAALGPIGAGARDLTREKPVSDERFALFRDQYAYDREPLEEKTEAMDDRSPAYRRESVSYRAAYDGQRIPAYLYLPKNAMPPYQTVLLVPGGYSAMLRSSEASLRSELFRFLVESGRAVLHPIYWTTYERQVHIAGANSYRDAKIRFAKDAFRSVDYIASRPDLDASRLAYFSISDGMAAIVLALEPRLKTGVLISNGLTTQRIPELDALHFAPRVRVPLLMVNGRNDLLINAPSQAALFQLFGTRVEKKRHSIFDIGHVPTVDNIQRETLQWLDREFGPVRR